MQTQQQQQQHVSAANWLTFHCSNGHSPPSTIVSSQINVARIGTSPVVSIRTSGTRSGDPVAF